jgi:YggT family protein
MAYVTTTPPTYTRMVQPSPPRRARPLFRLAQVVSYILWVVEALLVLRFVLRFLGANPSAAFSNFIYDITTPLVAPFAQVFQAQSVEAGAGSNIVEWGTLLAMVIYWLVAWAILRLLRMGRPVTTVEANQKLRRGYDIQE